MSHITLQNVGFWRKMIGHEGNTRHIFNDVSFTVNDGQRVALIGSNGSGKTTMLRLIAGILQPDSGTIECGSDISALLDSGYGMVDSLTARENCTSRLIVGGVPKREIPGIIDWVEDFVEIGEYFDQPMRSFSSGMFARIVFALATAKPHQIVLIDEGFGLADEHFRRKAQVVLDRLYSEASILMFASHNDELLRATCERGLVLSDGGVAFDGSIEDAISFNHSS
jgi:ABC-type polysaccharide/polyol phosphate transport system ATPase subunit